MKLRHYELMKLWPSLPLKILWIYDIMKLWHYEIMAKSSLEDIMNYDIMKLWIYAIMTLWNYEIMAQPCLEDGLGTKQGLNIVEIFFELGSGLDLDVPT